MGARTIPASRWTAGALRPVLCSDTGLKAVDLVLGVAGAALAFALSRSFLHWLKWPVDVDSLIALGIIIAFALSFMWFLWMVVRLVLRPRFCW
jgi:hypothetical protein